jgi:diacylglycerol kinase (ATP)
MKAKLIVNPVSGTDAAPEALASLNQQIRSAIGPLDIVMTVGEGDGIDAARRAVQDGYDHLFVAGGDGTLNEVLNGVGRVAGGFEAVTFGVIPMGTGNDFATALGLPDDAAAAVRVLLEERVRRVDVGRLNERHFVNVSAGGFIAEVSDAVDRRLKTIAGKVAYLIGGAQVLWDHQPVRARVRVDGAGRQAMDLALPLSTFAVCNSRLIGGGRLIAPYAEVDDGLLDLCLIRDMPAVEFVGLLRTVATGAHVDDERVVYLRAPALTLSFDRPIKVNVDGQVLTTERCDYDILPGAARFLAGRSSNAVV